VTKTKAPEPSPGPKARARIAGGLWLLVIATGVFALLVREALIVPGDAAATAANILAGETLFRLGFVADLISAGAYVGTTFLLYDLLKSVSRSVSLFAALTGLAGSAIMAANLANLLGALSYLKGGASLAAFEPDQLQALAMASLRLHGLGYTISVVVFAAHLLLLGWLLLRSAFLPRLLGLLLVIAGLCWWVNSLAIFLAPGFAGYLYPWILLPSLIAEGGLALWLLVMGVNVERWREQGRAKGTRSIER
jgi:Domain of unknown function (DUF4386)